MVVDLTRQSRTEELFIGQGTTKLEQRVDVGVGSRIVGIRLDVCNALRLLMRQQ